MVVCHHFVVCVLDVNAEKVLENSQVERFPMLIVDVGRRCLMRQQEPDQIHQTDLRLVLSHFKHEDELVYSLLRDAWKVEDLQPFLKVLDLSNFILYCVRVDKLLYNFFHFLTVTLCIERLKGQVSWFKLLEWKLIVLACLDKFALWHLF